MAVTTTTGTTTTTLCTVTLSAGTGACAVSSPTLLGVSATNPVVASYAGDANYSGTVSSTTPVNLAVTKAATSPPTVGVVPAGVIYGSEHTALIIGGRQPGLRRHPDRHRLGHHHRRRRSRSRCAR